MGDFGAHKAAELLRKGIAVDMLEKRIIELEVRNLELVVHNNELLDRARKAEWRIDAIKFAAKNSVGGLRSAKK